MKINNDYFNKNLEVHVIIMSFQNSCDFSYDLVENLGFATYFNHLLKTKKSSDVTFILETPDSDLEFSAHQLVLAMRSAYFADMFYGDQKERGKKIIRLENINPKAFEDMIRYCYDREPSLETLEEISALFKVSYGFKVISLLNLCRKHLLDIEIKPGNVFSMLEVSEYMEDKKLRDRCHNFLQEKTKDVMESYKMSQVTPVMVHIILDLPKLSLNSEIELIKWLFDWANSKLEEGDTVCRNSRKYLQNLLQDMNFLALTFEEFAKLCKDYPDFFTSEEIASICLNIAYPGTREMPDWHGKKIKIREYFRLTTKLIDKDIVDSKKCVVDILALEIILKCLMETVKCFSERYKKLQGKECDKLQEFLNFYILFKYFEPCYKICSQLSKFVGKRKMLKKLKVDEKDIQKMSQYCDATFVNFRGGGLKYLLDTERELKEGINVKTVFDRFKGELKHDEEAKRCQEKISENAKQYHRLKFFLENVEELEIVIMLENLHAIYKSYNEPESLNEFSKEMRSLVIEKIRKLSEDYFELLIELKQLLENIVIQHFKQNIKF